MEKFPFASGQPLRPDEEKRSDLDDVLKKLGDKVSEDATKENRKQYLRTLVQTEGWRAAQEDMTEEERGAQDNA